MVHHLEHRFCYWPFNSNDTIKLKFNRSKIKKIFFPGEDNCNAQYGINNVLIPVYLTKCGLKF